MSVDIHFANRLRAVEDDEDPTKYRPVVLVACPGNGTRYVLVITPIDDPQALRALGASEFGAVVVALWPGERTSASAVISRGGYLAPHYVAEKFGLSSPEDANAIATILGAHLDRPTASAR